jgi:hypothetical protein
MAQKFGIRALTPAVLAATFILATPVSAADEKSRVGTCVEAKSQSKYWCEERAKVTVISFGMECENAKQNVIEACEGKKSKDQAYTFPGQDKKKK